MCFAKSGEENKLSSAEFISSLHFPPPAKKVSLCKKNKAKLRIFSFSLSPEDKFSFV